MSQQDEPLRLGGWEGSNRLRWLVSSLLLDQTCELGEKTTAYGDGSWKAPKEQAACGVRLKQPTKGSPKEDAPMEPS